MKYNPANWRVPYEHIVFSDQRHTLVTYSLQLLLVLLLYPVPENASSPAPDGQKIGPPKNQYRLNMGRIHRAADFQFIVDGMKTVLNQPVRVGPCNIANANSCTFRYKQAHRYFRVAKSLSNGHKR